MSSSTRQIEYVDFQGPPSIGTTMEHADGTVWVLKEVTPPHVRLIWEPADPNSPGGVRRMETATAFAVEHMDLGRDEEPNRRFVEPPAVGTPFPDQYGWVWRVAGTAPAPSGGGYFDIHWIARDPITGQAFASTSGRRVWGSKLHRAKMPVQPAPVAKAPSRSRNPRGRAEKSADPHAVLVRELAASLAEKPAVGGIVR
jgi:hypothetical protein